MIGEGQHGAAHDLPGFKALAGAPQNIAASKEAPPGPDRLGAVGDFASSGATGQNFRPNGLGPFAARVVVRDDHKLGELGGDAPHYWPLASVPVAAAAKHANDATGSKAAQRLKRGLEGVRLVCVVDDDEPAAHATHDLKAASYALELGKGGQYPTCRLACGDGEPSREQRVRSLVIARERKVELAALPAVGDVQLLSKAFPNDRLETQCLAAPADAHHCASARARGGGNLASMLSVGVDHGG